NNDQLDYRNLAEEIESVGASEKREIRNRLRILCLHLLNWAYQPEYRSASWRGSIIDQRTELADVLKDSPSLLGYAQRGDWLAAAYQRGRDKAAQEAGLLALPTTCPWTLEQVLDPDFLPDAA